LQSTVEQPLQNLSVKDVETVLVTFKNGTKATYDLKNGWLYQPKKRVFFQRIEERKKKHSQDDYLGSVFQPC
jgi:hypothetical protein